VPARTAEAGLHDHISRKAAGSAYPVRAIRYWMTRELIREELERRAADGEGDALVVELGCSMGHVRRFVGDVRGLGGWIGLDFNASAEAEALSAGITSFMAADFDDPLPVTDGSADIVVFIHVLEHLPRPDFTLREIARVLRPGGILVAGSPVAPWPVSSFRDWVLKRKLAAGKIQRGGHIHALSRPRWRRLLMSAGLAPEFMNGAFLFRSSGSPLENSRAWFRLNVAWGSLFPALGNEIYLTARKGAAPSVRLVEAPRPVPQVISRDEAAAVPLEAEGSEPAGAGRNVSAGK
jgi:SAM-dependent methyltransferase